MNTSSQEQLKMANRLRITLWQRREEIAREREAEQQRLFASNRQLRIQEARAAQIETVETRATERSFR